MRISALLEAAGQVGRKYQHIEDLVIANGSHGENRKVKSIKKIMKLGIAGMFDLVDQP